MRTISSMAALHRGHDKVVPPSDIPLRRLKFESRHMNNGGKRVEFRRLSYFLVVLPFQITVRTVSETDLRIPLIKRPKSLPPTGRESAVCPSHTTSAARTLTLRPRTRWASPLRSVVWLCNLERIPVTFEHSRHGGRSSGILAG